MDTFVPPSQSELEAEAMYAYKVNHPNEYREMSRKDRAELATLKANAVRSEAEALIASGVYAGQAWARARKTSNLERDTD